MNKFDIGERVLIKVTFPPNMPNHPIAPGTVGVVLDRRGKMDPMIYTIKYAADKFEFFEDDLGPLHQQSTYYLHPDMELDEIERAEQIMEGLTWRD